MRNIFILAFLLISCIFPLRLQNSCGVADPIAELIWMQDIIATAANNCVGSIYQGNYDGVTYFWEVLDTNCPIADLSYHLYDCEGNIVCYFGEMLPDPNTYPICLDFFGNHTDELLIWNATPILDDCADLVACLIPEMPFELFVSSGGTISFDAPFNLPPACLNPLRSFAENIISVNILTTPSLGMVVVDGTIVTYSAYMDLSGSDSFIYEVCYTYSSQLVNDCFGIMADQICFSQTVYLTIGDAIPCECIENIGPVCAEGIDYANSCEAICSGHPDYTWGTCIEVCNPTLVGTVVSGCDGYKFFLADTGAYYSDISGTLDNISNGTVIIIDYNYNNTEAACVSADGSSFVGFTTIYINCFEVISECICEAIYEPVCAGGFTYSNACLAICDGVQDFVLGACSNIENCYSEVVVCGVSNPLLNLAWLQSKIDQYQTSCLNTVIAGDFNGQTYYYFMGGNCSGNPGPYLADGGFPVFDCEGNRICQYGFYGHDGTTNCDFSLSDLTNQVVVWSSTCHYGNCICPTEYLPVCADGVTYVNSCFAQCAGVMAVVSCDPPCICPAIYAPVCANGITYGNSCEAECAGVFNYTEGECVVIECEPSPLDDAVVEQLISSLDCSSCGWSLSQYCLNGNTIFVASPDLLIHPDGTISVCTDIPTYYYSATGDEICYSGGLTGGNCGDLIDFNQLIFVRELYNCNNSQTCICPDIYAPVCANGITYGNSCEAECAGVFNYTEGECVVIECEPSPLDEAIVEQLISTLDCSSCGWSLSQYCINGNTIFVASPDLLIHPDGTISVCTDIPTYYYSATGDEICYSGGLTGGNCGDLIDFNQLIFVRELYNCNNSQTCVCIAIYDPVCANGITYSNSCEAECAGEFNYTEGECVVIECEPSPLDEAVVEQLISTLDCSSCGWSLSQYCLNGNTIFVASPDILIYPDGTVSVCTDIPTYYYSATGDEICYSGGFTGGNCGNLIDFSQLVYVDELYNCNNSQICICPEIYAPVCANGITYSNSCEAECAGVFDYTEGECNFYCEVCNVSDPLTELGWLSNYMNMDCNRTITAITHTNGQNYFYVSGGFPCVDYPSYIFDCEGNQICGFGGLIIWENNLPICENFWEGVICQEVIWTSFVPCNCPDNYAPVCANGITYSNSCDAECAGVFDYTEGECVVIECEPSPLDEAVVEQLISTLDCSSCGWSLSQYCLNGNTIFVASPDILIYPDGTVSVCTDIPTYYYSATGDEICYSGGLTGGNCGDLIDFTQLIYVGELYNCNNSQTCVCPDLYDPVCAEGITYSNSCEAECAGVFDYTEGECAFSCDCPDVFAPVCSNGVTYSNACEAQCFGINVFTDGACTEPCDCIDVFAPVCAGGTVFPNACLAICAGAYNYSEGPCPDSDCNCSQEYEPVCLEDMIYPNACWADCMGVTGYANCQQDCDCPDTYLPVCAGGITYQNICTAQCAGVMVFEMGACSGGDSTCEQSDIVCDDIYLCTGPMETITVCPLALCSLIPDDAQIVDVSSMYHCSVTLVGSCVNYTPVPGMENVGLDYLDFVMQDSNGCFYLLHIDITIGICNNPPVANDDTAISDGSPVTICALDNDYDPDEDMLEICEMGTVTDGTVSMVEGCFIFAPNLGFEGIACFNYTVCDGYGEMDMASVCVDVSLPCEENDLSLCIEMMEPIEICPVFCDLNNDFEIISFETTYLCSLAQLSDHCIRYIPLPAFIGMDVIVITACDGAGNCQTLEYQIMVGDCDGSVNHPPLAIDDNYMATCANLAINVLSNDLDPDGDTITICGVSDVTNGTILQTPGGFVFTPALGYSGIVSFTYTICDGNGGEDSATVTIEVNCPDICEPDDIYECVAPMVPVEICVEFCNPAASLTAFESDVPCSITIRSSHCFRFLGMPYYNGVAQLHIWGCDINENCEDLWAYIEVSADCGGGQEGGASPAIRPSEEELFCLPILAQTIAPKSTNLINRFNLASLSDCYPNVETELWITNLNGQIIFREEDSAANIETSANEQLKELKNGMYLYQLIVKSAEPFEHKGYIIVQ